MLNAYEQRGTARQEQAEVQLLERELRENDLITSDSGLEDAKNVLRNNDVPFEVQKYTKGQMIDPANETRTPDEYVLVIKDKLNPDSNADFDATQRAFAVLKNAAVVVRYAKPHGESPKEAGRGEIAA